MLQLLQQKSIQTVQSQPFLSLRALSETALSCGLEAAPPLLPATSAITLQA